MRSRITLNAAGLALAVLLTACSTPAPAKTEPTASDPGAAAGGTMLAEDDPAQVCEPTPNTVDPAGFEYSAAYDYMPADSLSELVDGSDAAFTGCVAGWFEGRTDHAGNDYPEGLVIVAVRIDDVVKGNGIARGDIAYVSQPGGVSLLPQKLSARNTASGRRAAISSIVEGLNGAIPNGTRVIVTGKNWNDPAYTLDRRGPDGRKDPSLLIPSLQGLLFESAGGRFFGGAVPDADLQGIAAHASKTAGEGNGRVSSAGSFEWLRSELASRHAAQ